MLIFYYQRKADSIQRLKAQLNSGFHQTITLRPLYSALCSPHPAETLHHEERLDELPYLFEKKAAGAVEKIAGCSNGGNVRRSYSRASGIGPAGNLFSLSSIGRQWSLPRERPDRNRVADERDHAGYRLSGQLRNVDELRN